MNMKIMIIGCGRMGAGLALFLARSGHQVSVLDNDPAAFERLGIGFKGPTLLGDALGREALVSGGIDQADALAALTPSDNINIVVARLAREMFKVPKVIARMYDPRQSEIYRRLGVQTISPVSLSIQRLSELLTFSRLDIVHSLGSGEVGIVEAEVPLLLVGRKVQDVDIAGEIQVVSISRGGKTVIPTTGSVFKKGDMVHIAVVAASEDHLKSLLGFS
jgi:trk system potassium uptake protein